MDDEFELPDGSCSVLDIQYYIECITRKYKILIAIFSIHVNIDIINNRLVFKVKDGYQLELQTPETIILFGSTKKLIDKRKKCRKRTKS